MHLLSGSFFYFVAKLGANAIVMTMIITMTRRTCGRVCQEAEYVVEKPGSKWYSEERRRVLRV